jgi:choline transport protein
MQETCADCIHSWTSTLAWQAGNAQGVFLAGSLVQILISLYDEAYTWPQWHTTLLAIAATVLAFFANTYGAKWLHLWQNTVFTIHILAYIAFITPIWVNAPRATHSQVWSQFTWNGGWPTTGLAAMVGQQVGIFGESP